MIEYVLILGHTKSSSGEDMIAFIQKKRPENQRGKFNLVGGKVEKNEYHDMAAQREFQEETGLLNYVLNMDYRGVMFGDEDDETRPGYKYTWKVHLYNFYLDKLRQFEQGEDEDEYAIWKSFPKILDDDKLMTNLKVVIPLMLYGSKNRLISVEDKNGELLIKC